MDLLSASYRNMPEIWDQEMNQPRHAVSLKDEKLSFPTMPMYNRIENFSHFDLDTLFFSFYYQQGTYQQYYAAVELKRKNWMFNKKYHTWFRKTEAGDPLSKGQANKFVYFDYETSWT